MVERCNRALNVTATVVAATVIALVDRFRRNSASLLKGASAMFVLAALLGIGQAPFLGSRLLPIGIALVVALVPSLLFFGMSRSVKVSPLGDEFLVGRLPAFVDLTGALRMVLTPSLSTLASISPRCLGVFVGHTSFYHPPPVARGNQPPLAT